MWCESPRDDHIPMRIMIGTIGIDTHNGADLKSKQVAVRKQVEVTNLLVQTARNTIVTSMA